MLLYNLRKIINKIEKKFKISLYFFFPLRLLTRVLEILYLRENKDLLILSNYYLDPEKIKKEHKIILISAGIADDVSFELSLNSKFNVEKMILIDPNALSGKITKEYLPSAIFIEGALFDTVGEKKIYIPEDPSNLNLSIKNLYNVKKFINVKTFTVKYLIEKYNLSRISILKLDVEGVANEIIKNCFLNNIFPNQICFELERPLSPLSQFNYFKDFMNTIKLLKSKGYALSRTTNSKLGLRFEILASKI